MDAASAASLLASVPACSVLDSDVRAYFCSMLADLPPNSTSHELSHAMTPFLASAGVADGTFAGVQPVVQALYAGACERGWNASAVVSTSAAAALLAGKSADDRAPVRVLSAPVSLGAASVDSAALDILWGKAENSYLKQNSILEYAADGSRAAKRAARDAKKEESRLRFESAKAEAAAAADAASRREVVATSTVTYTLTEERKRQDVNITGFSMGYGGELLLSNADLHIVAGRRYGLVGRNGMGKSTLLRHMAHGEVAGAGAQTFPKNMRVLHVEQEVVGDSTNVLQTVLDADVERSRLLREEASLTAFLEGVNEEATAAGTAAGWTIDTANERIATIAARLEAIDAASAEARASAILAGLGFTNDMQTWPTKSLSGGWRMRVALAAALFCEPDVLCLDEPTNHIDAKSTLWLVEYLLTYPHTLIIVSHDRWFLNQVCTDVIHLTDRHLEYYRGDYDTYERLRAEKARHAARAAESQDMKRAHIQAFIDKFRYNAKRASLVQSRIKALERMEVLEEVADDPKWRFEFPDPGALPIPVLQIDDVTFGYRADKPLFRGVNFNVDMSSRIALVGPNGVGKSTLLKLILGELESQSGLVVRNPKLRIACFTQHHVNQLDLSLSANDFLLRIFPGAKPDAVRSHLGSFGISGDLALQRMGTMSGGQKSRVAFAILTWKKPHVLVLDEPSNNLDIETIDAVIVALANFKGGVIIVSHDQHFVESVCDEIFVVGQPPQRVTQFKGEFAEYRRVAQAEKAIPIDNFTARS